ncbi:enoyl-CoA hydratase/isomerase family protein [Bacillus sp. B-jedd]|uniref:enoyl-CoA hydratase/isomerase family protein n=1 Tax=Bacillus sp. B-jedd TaxID=1476857 RepID=UPI0005156330|nr:enoyl-CoA hydratase-related protein [Bacillus sp. B-jedd]CEG27335.1 enoyl-CoA hydratase [Bacillus sp. B-jedd]
MSSSPRFIEIRTEGPVAFIELNRPEVLNALNRQMIAEILAAMEEFDRDEAIRVIVLSGKGRCFAAGADIDEMAEAHSVEMELLNQFTDWDRLSWIKKPIIGAVHGFALGGAFELALCCDLLFAAEDAEFGFPEVLLGIMPGAGGTVRLTKLAGKTKAMEWLFTGKRISAKEARDFGLVNQLYAKESLMEETARYARQLANMPPISIRYIKESVLKAIDASIYEGMQFERKNFSLLFSTADQKEGMKAFIEKRKAKFEGR